MFPFDDQSHIGGGGSRAEGLQGPARLLCGTPGQVLALPVEVCTVPNCGGTSIDYTIMILKLNVGDLDVLGHRSLSASVASLRFCDFFLEVLRLAKIHRGLRDRVPNPNPKLLMNWVSFNKMLYFPISRHMNVKCSKQPDLPVLDTSVPMDQVSHCVQEFLLVGCLWSKREYT